MPAPIPMLTASFARQYPTVNKNGETMHMFVYFVDGTTEELAHYEEVQGSNFRREDDKADGRPLWFSTKYYGEDTNLIITRAREDKPSRVVADTDDISKQMSLLQRFQNTPIAEALAQQIAAQLLGNTVKAKAQAPVAPKTEPKDEPMDRG